MVSIFISLYAYNNSKGLYVFDKISNALKSSSCGHSSFSLVRTAVCMVCLHTSGHCLCMCSDPGQNPSWPRPAQKEDVSSLSQASPQGCFQFSSAGFAAAHENRCSEAASLLPVVLCVDSSLETARALALVRLANCTLVMYLLT